MSSRLENLTPGAALLMHLQGDREHEEFPTVVVHGTVPAGSQAAAGGSTGGLGAESTGGGYNTLPGLPRSTGSLRVGKGHNPVGRSSSRLIHSN